MNEMIFIYVGIGFGIAMYILERRIRRLEKAIIWFAEHIRIDDRDLAKTPIPEDLRDIINNLDGQDESL